MVRIGFLGFAPKGRLLECCNQLLKPFDPLVLAGDMFVLAGYRDVLGRLACLRRDQHRLQGGNIIGKVGGIKHGQKLSNPTRFDFGIRGTRRTQLCPFSQGRP
ncbi:protein of unknown function [Agrobacterium pusense]|uniref:Uncharacterized protein n=1 Tax=Agrobacterium pusense TaxID=648995 RepID=U4Q1A5_9HYPH|nr:protein of unknown function [Agrobacterium pusense]